MTCSARHSADGKANRFSFGELAPIIDFDRTPFVPVVGLDPAIAVLRAGDPAADRAVVANPASCGGSTRARWRSRSGSCGPIVRARIAAWAILAVLLGWVVLIQSLFGDLASGAMLSSFLIGLQFLSLVVFVGGTGVMLWYAYTAWKSKWHWTAKAWSVLLVIAAATVALRRARLEAHRLRDQLLMPKLGLGTASKRCSSPPRSGSRAMCSRHRTWSSSSLTTASIAGRGEAAGVYYLGDDVAHIVARAGGAPRGDRGRRRPRGAAAI